MKVRSRERKEIQIEKTNKKLESINTIEKITFLITKPCPF